MSTRLLSDAELQQFKQDGYLLVEDLLPSEALDRVCDEIAGKVERLALQLHKQGHLQNLHADKDFFSRLTHIEAECPGTTVMLHVAGELEPALADLWSHPNLLAIVEQFLGPDIVGHPIWNIRCKTPSNPLATVPWHQDTAYLAEGSEHTFQPAAWVPFLDVGEREGTLQFIKGGNHQGVCRHHLHRDDGPSNSWYLQIKEEDLPDGERVIVPVRRGSVLFLDQMIPHRSTENYSDTIRWSVDLRWQRPGEPTGMDLIAPPVRMLAGGKPVDIQWDDYIGHVRNENLDGFQLDEPSQVADGVKGPWIDRWEAAALQ